MQPIVHRLRSWLRTFAADDKPERTMAFLIDVFLSMLFSVFPFYGWVVAIAYFFLKDALPFGITASVGNNIYGYRVVNISPDGKAEALPWYKSVARNLLILVPILNIIDLISFLRRRRRFCDEWLGVLVIRNEY